MRISAKARYGLFAIVEMASLYDNGDFITLVSLSDKLNISKIYLEQVFSLLRHAKIVFSAKGAQGGYKLTKAPADITVYDILVSVETSLFEETEETTAESANYLEETVREVVFKQLDDSIKNTLSNITLAELVKKSKDYGEGYMYYL